MRNYCFRDDLHSNVVVWINIAISHPDVLDNILGIYKSQLLLPGMKFSITHTHTQYECYFGQSENGWKSLKWKRSQNIPANDQLGLPESVLFCMMDKGPRGMFWTKVAQFGPTGTPQKSAFFQERGRKRMKELGEVTFMKEGMKALDDTRILALTHLKFVVSFPRYGHLKKKKCWYEMV